MKTIISFSLLVLLVAGCKTGPTPQQMASSAQFAAYTGASIDMAKSTNHCASYAAVTKQLDRLDATSDYDPAHFAFALQSLPIKELKDPRAKIIIGSVIILWDAYAGQITLSNQVQYVKPVLQGTDLGLKQAMMDSGCP